jgi:hypothetical protein
MTVAFFFIYRYFYERMTGDDGKNISIFALKDGGIINILYLQFIK